MKRLRNYLQHFCVLLLSLREFTVTLSKNNGYNSKLFNKFVINFKRNSGFAKVKKTLLSRTALSHQRTKRETQLVVLVHNTFLATNPPFLC